MCSQLLQLITSALTVACRLKNIKNLQSTIWEPIKYTPFLKGEMHLFPVMFMCVKKTVAEFDNFPE